jgi:hypothetical protein
VCTLSVIRIGPGAFRVVHNRDEQRTRAPGEPAAWRDLPGTGGTRAIWPIDPEAGGTWIAAREDGVVYAILNVNPSADLVPPGESRGRVITDLLDRPADEPLRHPLSRRMRSYRIVRVRPEGGRVLVDWHRSFGEDETGGAFELDRPVCWVSSGLGDDRVEPRLPLFEAMVGSDPTPAAQDAFHRHAWPDRPEISVMMSRDEARTTGVTTVEVVGGEVSRGGVDLSYEPID